jgi:hypothetical protein
MTPTRRKEAQTGGGFIQVQQLAPNAVLFLMRGAVVAGPHCTGHAAMQFDLTQDFEVLPTCAGVLPPRLSLSAWMIGTLQSQTPGGGTAEQAEGAASVQADGQSVLNVALQPHGVSGGQNLFVNDREGPVETQVCPGLYCLQQSFGLSATQPCSLHHAGAAADFDPDAKLDSRWDEVLKPFRAVPHRDFGFRVIIRVVEDTPPPCVLHPRMPRPVIEQATPSRGKIPFPEEELSMPRQRTARPSTRDGLTEERSSRSGSLSSGLRYTPQP